jgi:hypothetical protein
MRGSAASRTGGRVGIEGKVFEGQVRGVAPYALGEVKPRQSYTNVEKGRSASESRCDMGADKEGSYLGRPARHQGKAHLRSRAVRVHEEEAARENP